MHLRVLLAIALASGAVIACSSSSSSGSGSPTAVCPADNPNCREAANVDTGAQQVKNRKCVDCHTSTLAGSQTPVVVAGAASDVKIYPPNLTSDDDTGLGKWTDEQIARAIRTGVDDQELQLCPQMKHDSTMSDFEVFSIVMYLRSIPKVHNDVPKSICPPFKT